MKRLVFVLVPVAAALVLGGCGSADAVPGHTAEEDQAIAKVKSMTPEEQIRQIQNSPQPEGAKAAMIDKIKREHGIK